MSAHPTAPELSVVKTRKQRRRFINFPYRLYKNDGYWVPPLRMEQKKLIDTHENPFFENADIGLFIIERDGKMCGRIAAIEDHRFNDFHNSKTGFFGFFECVDDAQAAGQLFGAAEKWLQDRDLDEMLGPTSPSMMDEIGVLIDGFEYYPSFLMPYTKPYYPALLEAEGLEKEMDLFAFRVSQKTVALDRMRRAREIVHKRMPALKLRQVDKKNLDEEVQIVRKIFNEAWSENWGFIPLTEAELEELAEDLKMILDPKFAHIIEVEGEPVAFSIALPDLNQALRHMNGRLVPFGLFKLLWYQRKIDRVRTALMGVMPKFQGKGIDALLHLRAIENGLAEGYDSSELGWVLESNKNMVRTAERIGAHIEKTYRVYRKDLG